MLSDDKLRISPERVEVRTEVIKNNEIFLITLPDGSVPCGYPGGLGLFYRDTRFLSALEFYVEGTGPHYLSSGTRQSSFFQCDLANPELKLGGGVFLPLQTVHFRILRVIQGALYQRFRVRNYNLFPVDLTLSFRIGADYRDLFEVRGMKRLQRGELFPPKIEKDGVTFQYVGRDDLLRTTVLRWDLAPEEVEPDGENVWVRYRVRIPPKERVYLYWAIAVEVSENKGTLKGISLPTDLKSAFLSGADAQRKEFSAWRESCTEFVTPQERFNQMLAQALADLWVLRTVYPEGPVMEAGIPWFATAFGRDALITAWQTLIVNPEICREVLRFLVKFQGQKVDPTREEEPGKIIHEIRRGEMANCREILHTPYYGSIDATLWFIIVLGDFVNWTHDLDFLEEMREPLLKALAWCTDYGDKDKDGYIEYYGDLPGGLKNQGWKDSWDGILDPEGKPVEPPVALVEVQAYLYAAYVRASRMFSLLEDKRAAKEYEDRSRQLRRNFHRDFWVEEHGCLGLALDGKKRLIKTVASNMGHTLFTGILQPTVAKKVARKLLSRELFSGWGIRTLSTAEKGYNSISYHNGSIWPHDNSIIAYGLRRYNFLEELQLLAEALFDAAYEFPYFRFPELFCGFSRRPNVKPVRYPVACEPQAWAVGSIFLLLQACIGVRVTSEGLLIQRPVLPSFLKELQIRRMRVHGGKVGIDFISRGQQVFCLPVEKTGSVKVIIEA